MPNVASAFGFIPNGRSTKDLSRGRIGLQEPVEGGKSRGNVAISTASRWFVAPRMAHRARGRLALQSAVSSDTLGQRGRVCTSIRLTEEAARRNDPPADRHQQLMRSDRTRL